MNVVPDTWSNCGNETLSEKCFEKRESAIPDLGFGKIKQTKNKTDMKSPVVFHATKLEFFIERQSKFYDYNDILYIYYEKPYSVIKYPGKKSQLVHSPISDFAEHLPDIFVRNGRSCIINLSEVVGFDIKKMEIVMSDSKVFHLASSKKEEFMRRILKIAPKCSESVRYMFF
jgi:DNA-binding LytR/AlgR family response regulator